MGRGIMAVASCKAWPLLGTRLSNVGACRGMAVDIGGMRKPYGSKEDIFDFKHLVAREPFAQFKAWFDEATKHEKVYEANAMCLATASADGFPSARMVLLKKYGPEGFTFYTNYGSRKAGELDANPRAALVFYWEALNRSIRVEGKVGRVPEQESNDYFHSRPLSSQIGACVSEQSTIISGREVLTSKEEELEKKHVEGGVPVPRPDWGGYRVEPSTIEFWQGQSNRIHDRLRFRRATDGEQPKEGTVRGEDGWLIERLAP